MNLLLLYPEDLTAPDRAVLQGRRLQHLREILASSPGDRLRAGLLGGLMGSAEVLQISESSAELQLQLDTPPPPKLPLTLLLALPRPKMIRRILRTCAELGVEELILLNSYRVEKSFWQSPLLQESQLNQYLDLGLEQSRDTQRPRIRFARRFKPFVEDELPALLTNRQGIVAHPHTRQQQPQGERPTLLAIGPEGGFIPYEVEKLCAAGCQPWDLGPRILRVENAVNVCIAKLF